MLQILREKKGRRGGEKRGLEEVEGAVSKGQSDLEANRDNEHEKHI